MTRTETPDEPPARAQRAQATRSVLQSGAVALLIVVGYFVLPMTNLSGDTVAWLGLGLAGFGVLLVWQVREIIRSPFPRARAAGALITSVPLFFALFSVTYFVMSRTQPDNFNEPLTRLDAAYFTVTVFATVGFGDIVAVSQPARTVVLVQMLGDLLIVGLVARVLLKAVQAGLERHGR